MKRVWSVASQVGFILAAAACGGGCPGAHLAYIGTLLANVQGIDAMTRVSYNLNLLLGVLAAVAAGSVGCFVARDRWPAVIALLAFAAAAGLTAADIGFLWFRPVLLDSPYSL